MGLPLLERCARQLIHLSCPVLGDLRLQSPGLRFVWPVGSVPVAGKPRCPYPGEPANGRLQPVKFAYVPGDKITVSCNAGYVAPLEARPECRPNGTWSEPLPTCTIYSEV